MSDLVETLRTQFSSIFHDNTTVIIRAVAHDTAVCYLPELINIEQLNKFVLTPLQQVHWVPTSEQLKRYVMVGEVRTMESIADAIPLMMKGWVYVATPHTGVVVNIANIPNRQIGSPQNETTILGPMLAFNESLETNTALLRSSIPNTALHKEAFKIGNKRNTSVHLMYMTDQVEESCANIVRQRIQQLYSNDITGSSELMHLIQDNDSSIFPQMILTERVDLASHSLLEGKIVILVDGSPLVIIGPSEFTDFFLTTEDRYMGWGIGTFLRILRMLALLISVYLTPAYVAALTFHYEIIPSSLLVSLIESRSRVPFPPLFETLILELTMELLREAGARLPTKVGQTMGIVGGIVIGQAAVQAGFTSNILIMLVALAALGSFATPNYLMSSTLRLIRYPMVIFAGLWGSIGIVFFSVLATIHLIRQTSLGQPYFYPIHPSHKSSTLDQDVLMPELKGLTSTGHRIRKYAKSFRLSSLWTGKIDN
ncbi:spore germination protein [Paenibacillus selenitireducens]|uniref:Spore germination protein n=1 Tax=Paenibacillus selenitireducens TaxID=1324314 RepID=A0A1T2X5I0_9BACL|nr:spore germination protein [Paenibacillus selenitireducens]OPA75092.1 spore germination protein [Paenibacillus selenitireducens]